MEKERFDKKKLLNVAVILLLIFIPMMLSYTYRIQSDKMPYLESQAQDAVVQYYKSQLSPSVEEDYSFVSEAEREQILNEQIGSYFDENEDRVRKEIDILSEKYKESLRNEDDDAYLLAIDPYMQYQYSRNYLETGTWGNAIVDGEPVNELRGGRLDHNDGPRFHPWLMTQFHKLMSVFTPSQSLLKSVFLFPVIWTTLAIIPAFFIGWRLSKSKIAGFLAGVVVAVHPAVLSRTMGGFSDTDTHNVFFPLYILWMVVESLRAKDLKNKLIWSGFGAFFTGVYALAWQGWWHIFDFMFVAMLGYVIWLLVKEYYNKRKVTFDNVRNDAYNVGVYFFGTALLGGLVQLIFRGTFNGFSLIWRALTSPFAFIRYQEVGITNIWPNVFTTVAELNAASVSSIMQSSGTKIFYFLGLIGMVLVLLNQKNLSGRDRGMVFGALGFYLILGFMSGISNMVYLALVVLPIAAIAIYSAFSDSELDIKYMLLLGIMFAGTLYAATRGVRFTSLFVPVLVMGLAVTFGVIYKRLSDYLSKELEINVFLTKAVLLILLLIVLLPSPVTRGWDQATHTLPSYNDAWDNTLKTINENSEDAIITSWWDFGHWFVAGSQRRVTFDGGDQGRRIHWVGKTLLTSDEDEAVDILRMLNCGQNTAAEYLEEKMSSHEAVVLVNEVISLPEDDASQALLDAGLSEEEADLLLEKTHCSDIIDQYFIASRDMISKSGVWAHFGSWDFDKALMFNQVKGKSRSAGVDILVDNFSMSENDAKLIQSEIQKNDGDDWIAAWPSYYNNEYSCKRQNNTIACQTGVNYDMEADQVFIHDGQSVGYPQNALYVNLDGELSYAEYDDNTTDFGVILFEKDNQYRLKLAHPELTNSMFTKMYFFEGKGLERFEPVSYEKGPDGTDIYLYKVNLTGNADE